MATILVVDDSAVSRRQLVALLGSRHHRVLEADSAVAALELLYHEPADLVVSDILMPNMDGYELVRQLRLAPSLARMRVVFYSASYDPSEAQVLAQAGGVVRHLTKPAQPQEILRAVEAALAAEEPGPPPITEEFDREHLRLLTDKLADNVAELGRANELLRSIVDHVVDGIITADEYGTIESFNRAAEKIFGFTADEVIGKNVKLLMPEPFRSAHEAYMASYLRTRQPKIIGSGLEIIGRRKDGSTFPAEIAVSEVQFDGRLFFTGILRDITERRQAEQALRASEERFRAMAETVPEILFTCGPDGSSDYNNPRFYEYTGLSPGSAEGYGWVHVLHPDDAERATTLWQQAVATGEPFEIRYRYRAGDGSYRWFLGRARPIRDETGGIVKWFGSCSDIDDLIRAQEALKQADRCKDQFLAMLGHELRNPLGAILNASHVLAHEASDPAAVARAQDVIRRQALHMSRLLDDLLDVARVTQRKIILQKRSLDVRTLVEDALASVRPLVDSKHLEITVAVAGTPMYVLGDPARLLQVLVNLLSNAAKYTPAGESVRLTLDGEEGQAVIRVRDNGVGIAPEMLEHIFELFVQCHDTLDRSEAGLGVGLTLVRALVEMHGGQVSAHSAGLGHGSEFVVRLPLCRPPRAKGRKKTAGPRGIRKKPKLVIVEDNADSREMLKMLLELDGYDVQTASDGLRGVAAILAHRPCVALVDIGLPELDGHQVARRVREEGADDVYLIALTGYGQHADRQAALEAGFDDHLVKPVDPDDLTRSLSRHARNAEVPDLSSMEWVHE
jgi:PAS domain S-box-containing protein